MHLPLIRILVLILQILLLFSNQRLVQSLVTLQREVLLFFIMVLTELCMSLCLAIFTVMFINSHFRKFPFSIDVFLFFRS